MTVLCIIGAVVCYLIIGILIDAALVKTGTMNTHTDEKKLAVIMLLWGVIAPISILYIIWLGILVFLEEFEK